MAAREREAETRSGGMRLRARFTLLMSACMAVVMAAAGFMLFRTSANVATNLQESSLATAARLSAEVRKAEFEIERNAIEARTLDKVHEQLAQGDLSKVTAEVAAELRRLAAEAKELKAYWHQTSQTASEIEGGKVLRADVEYGPDNRPGKLYRVGKSDERPFHMLVPAESSRPPDRALLGLIIGTVVLVLLVTAGVSVWVAGQVSGPLEEIVGDIRQISTGDLYHRTRARGGGELGTLARSIDRMTKNLAEAREAELALSIRDRELEVAAEVREALLPQTTPQLEGYEVGATHISSDELWGDFHDYVDVADGRCVGLLVCDVSGKGLPGALVGATARSYLRSALGSGQDLLGALQAVNRDLARDVKRGMYVSALYVLVDPAEGVAHVACAGHKMPLVRYTAEDGKVRLIQPGGIALAFDKGPIFDRRLEVAHVPIEPGDRLVLVNTGAVAVTDPEGRELGEKPLYAQVMKHGAKPTEAFLEHIRAALEGFAGESQLPRAVSIVTVARKA
jgi:serine phosphatase RsbU (regulator of sigma subunit)